MQDRQRASYSHGLIGLNNPDPNGLLEAAVYCPSDRMYHVRFNYDAATKEDDSYDAFSRTIAERIREANRVHNGADPRAEGGGGRVISFWFPGDTDLEDMVAIMERVKELDTTWLRPALNELKKRCGLDEEDFPYLDRDDNYNNMRRVVWWYEEGWISGKGGTLVLSSKIDRKTLRTLRECMWQKGAIPEQSENFDRHDYGSHLSIRFTWLEPLSDVWETREAMHDLLRSVRTPKAIIDPVHTLG